MSKAPAANLERPAEGTPGRSAATPLWVWGVPALVTLVLTLWRIRGPSYGRDEAATLSAVQRPFTALLRMLGNIDVVHGGYYVVMWPVVRLAGSGELATRLPSALAVAAAAAATAGLGARLVSTRAGIAAGLVLAVLPRISLFGQTARPYAIVTALAVIAGYLLVRAMQATATGGRICGWLTWYAACLVVLIYLHPFALLLILAHAAPIARAWLGRSHTAALRRLALGWLAAVAGVVALAIPLLALSFAQRVPLNWAKAPAGHSIADLRNLIGPGLMVAAAGLSVLTAIAVSAMGGRARLQASWPGNLLALCLPWLILPPAILIGVSLVTPVYVFRYIEFCAPAAALLVGTGLAVLGWRAGAAAFAIIMVLGAPAQLQARSPGGHGDDIRKSDQIVAENKRPGDALWYTTLGEPIIPAYSYGFQQLRNVELAQTPIQSATLGGTLAKEPLVQDRVAQASRVWVVRLNSAWLKSPGQPPLPLQKLGFKKIRAWHTTGVWLSLFARPHSG